MMHDKAPTHRRLAEIGLRAGGPHGFALAGGHAVAAHGILQRPSEDVDLFADWQRRADFPAAVEVVIAAYVAAGYQVEIDHRTETFARIYLTDPVEPSEHHRVELVANWRSQPPVLSPVSPGSALSLGCECSGLPGPEHARSRMCTASGGRGQAPTLVSELAVDCEGVPHSAGLGGGLMRPSGFHYER
nr:hypothetical protein GCM10020063_087540 [Dactylosporangium thailandense]